MTATAPLVSAVVTTHNRADLLPRALDSVVVQSYPNIELVVVDDGSTDTTSEVIKRYEGQRSLKYLRLEKPAGACGARNKGIREASGSFVAGLDDDDKWHEDRISLLMAAYAGEYSCVTSDVTLVYPRGTVTWKKQQIIDLDALLYTNQVGNQVLVPREHLLEVGGFDPQLNAAQDYDLWVRLCSAFGPIRNVQESLQTIYMDHQSGRITDVSAFGGYLRFYQKHKHRMSREQRKYQLYTIRRAQDKRESLREFLGFVPTFRYWKEIKRILKRKFLL